MGSERTGRIENVVVQLESSVYKKATHWPPIVVGWLNLSSEDEYDAVSGWFAPLISEFGNRESVMYWPKLVSILRRDNTRMHRRYVLDLVGHM